MKGKTYLNWVQESGELNILITTRKRSLGQGNVFTRVCHSVHKGSLTVWLPGPMFLLGGLRPGGSLSGWGSLSRGISVEGINVRAGRVVCPVGGLCQGDPRVR